MQGKAEIGYHSKQITKQASKSVHATSVNFNPPLLQGKYIPFTHRDLPELPREFVLSALSVVISSEPDGEGH